MNTIDDRAGWRSGIRFPSRAGIGLLVFGLLLAAQIVFPARGVATDARIAPRVLRALEDPAVLPAPDDRLTIWVYFEDRPGSGRDLERALDVAEQNLSPRALARRRRASMAGGRIVDERDLPLDPQVIAAVQATGARLRRTSRLLNAASFEATADQIRSIASHPGVSRIEPVASFRRSGTDRADADVAPVESATAARGLIAGLDYGASGPGLEQINVPLLHEEGLSGEGVLVALFDTGFELTHECLATLDVVATRDFVGGDENVGQEPGDPQGSSDHGTRMLGLLAGYSPGNLVGPAYRASVLLARTEDIGSEFPVEEDNWIAALEWAEALGVDVVSSSVGYYYWYDFADLDGETAAITVAADLAALRGVSVVVSAGNERGNPDWPHIIAPADGRHVLAVGGVDRSGFVTNLSSPGPTADGRTKPDVMALAYGNIVPLPTTDHLYVQDQGVDAAVPLVAGVVALLRQRAPALTPDQILVAIRETASRSLLPDDDYGWGVTNARGAAHYWSPRIQHEPLNDVESSPTAFPVVATLEARIPLIEGGVVLHWRVAGGHWQSRTMSAGGGMSFTAFIDPQPSGATVEYTVSATNELGLTEMEPREGVHSFSVMPDRTPPAIAHRYLPDHPAADWPPLVVARVEDHSGISRVELRYSINGGAWQDPVSMEAIGSSYEASFPALGGVLPAGTRISYAITAYDDAASPNFAASGPYGFELVESRGRVAVVTNRYEPSVSSMSIPRNAPADARGAMQAEDATLATSLDIAQWIREAGFEAEVLKSEYVNSSSLVGFDVVVFTTGNYLYPLAHPSTVEALLRWVRDGGRLLIESGDAGYVAANFAEFADFAREVLHIEGFAVDDGLELRAAVDAVDHALLHRPNELPSPLPSRNTPGVIDYGASDVVFPADDARVIMHPLYGSSTGGLLAVDDDTGPDGGRIVYIPLDIGQLYGSSGRFLIENALTYLTIRESAGPSAVSGRVRLQDRTDHAGVVVRAGRGVRATTDADGRFELRGLWGGRYTVEAEMAGYSQASVQVELAEGEILGGMSLDLIPVLPVHVETVVDQAIPDNQAAGLQSTLDVAASGDVVSVNVSADISHFSAGHLRVVLTSPSGTSVTLHAPSDDLSDDLVGTWPTTLVVDGPGDLEDLVGEPVAGMWNLTVADVAFGATGRFNAWALDLLVTADPATVAEPADHRRSRVVGVSPNPLNPRTTIQFELAEAGLARLAVYDVRGRLIRVLVDEPRQAGVQTVAWDGTDARGNGVASGVYFARLVAGGAGHVHKLVLVR